MNEHQIPLDDTFLSAAAAQPEDDPLRLLVFFVDTFFMCKMGNLGVEALHLKCRKLGHHFTTMSVFPSLIVAEQLWTVRFDVKGSKYHWPTAVRPAGAGCEGIGGSGCTNMIGGEWGMGWGCGSRIG